MASALGAATTKENGLHSANHVQPRELSYSGESGLNPRCAVMEDLHDKIEHRSGMKRSSVKPRFDLLAPSIKERAATVLEFGAVKYGEFNWQKAVFSMDRDAIIDTFNHLQGHLDRAISITRDLFNGENVLPSEDDLGAIVFNAMVVSELWNQFGFTPDYFRAMYQDHAAKLKYSREEELAKMEKEAHYHATLSRR